MDDPGTQLPAVPDAGSLPSVASSVRIGDAERERAASALGENYAAGRIDREEFEARLSAIYRATTAVEVNRWFADLPGAAPVQEPATPETHPDDVRGRTSSGHRPHFAFSAAVPLLVLVIVALVGVSMATDGHFPWFFLPVAWFWFGGRRMRRSWNHNGRF